MALETLKDFVEKAKADESIKKELVALSSRQDTDALKDFMKEHGVSEEDLRELQDQREVSLAGGELSDEMLETVAGGGEKACFIWTSHAGGTCHFIYV